MHCICIAEIMGRHSNILLVNADTGKFLDAIKHVTKLKPAYGKYARQNLYLPPNDRLTRAILKYSAGAERMIVFSG